MGTKSAEGKVVSIGGKEYTKRRFVVGPPTRQKDDQYTAVQPIELFEGLGKDEVAYFVAEDEELVVGKDFGTSEEAETFARINKELHSLGERGEVSKHAEVHHIEGSWVFMRFAGEQTIQQSITGTDIPPPYTGRWTEPQRKQEEPFDRLETKGVFESYPEEHIPIEAPERTTVDELIRQAESQMPLGFFGNEGAIHLMLAITDPSAAVFDDAQALSLVEQSITQRIDVDAAINKEDSLITERDKELFRERKLGPLSAFGNEEEIERHYHAYHFANKLGLGKRDPLTILLTILSPSEQMYERWGNGQAISCGTVTNGMVMRAADGMTYIDCMFDSEPQMISPQKADTNALFTHYGPHLRPTLSYEISAMVKMGKRRGFGDRINEYVEEAINLAPLRLHYFATRKQEELAKNLGFVDTNILDWETDDEVEVTPIQLKEFGREFDGFTRRDAVYAINRKVHHNIHRLASAVAHYASQAKRYVCVVEQLRPDESEVLRGVHDILVRQLHETHAEHLERYGEDGRIRPQSKDALKLADRRLNAAYFDPNAGDRLGDIGKTKELFEKIGDKIPAKYQPRWAERIAA